MERQIGDYEFVQLINTAISKFPKGINDVSSLVFISKEKINLWSRGKDLPDQEMRASVAGVLR